MDSEGISQEQAAAALATIEESRGLIQAERATGRGRRYLQHILFALAPLVEYAPKDLIRSRLLRWTIRGAWQGTLFALSMRAPVISRMPSFGSKQSMKRPVATTSAIVAAMTVSERLVVFLLRRSRLRRPNVVAGFAIVPLRAGSRFLLGRLARGEQPTPTGAAEPHPALLPPDTLGVAALLGEGELVDLAFIRDAFGIDQLSLAGRLQPLIDDKLATTLHAKDTYKVYLTRDGRDVYARHLRALRGLSTGDTPR
ncbi:hypothetical protein [Flindersiella endophytica]